MEQFHPFVIKEIAKIMKNKSSFIKVIFCIAIIIDCFISAYLTYWARHSVSPEWNWYILGIITLIFASIVLGPGMVISCLIGIIIGFLQ